jgi:hypothetical protein
MTLADRISAAQDQNKNKYVCKLMMITKDPKLSKKDVDALTSVINSTEHSDGHIPNSRLAHALREEGYDISSSAVDRHRGARCACYRLAGEK